jgi:hypothetical protein
MAVVVLIPFAGTLLSFYRVRRPLRIGILTPLLAHVFRSRASGMIGVTGMVALSALCKHRAAISKNNTCQQYRQAFIHDFFPFSVVKIFYLWTRACIRLPLLHDAGKELDEKDTTRIRVLVLDLGTPSRRSRPNLPALLTAHNAHRFHPFTYCLPSPVILRGPPCRFLFMQYPRTHETRTIKLLIFCEFFVNSRQPKFY